MSGRLSELVAFGDFDCNGLGGAKGVRPRDAGKQPLEFAGRLGQLLVQILHLPRPVGNVRQVKQRAVKNQDLK